MRRVTAAVGSAVFFAVAPGTVVGLVPWLLTGWHVGTVLPWPLRALGVVMILAGLAVLVPAFVRFVIEGGGTPAPVAPTRTLVVGGLYRYLRNPMYVAVVSAILGQALLLGRVVLLWYGLLAIIATVVFVKAYEEPYLKRRYGSAYEEYRRQVPGWWPRAPRRDG